MDFIDKLGTQKINDYSAARVMAAGQEVKAYNNNIFEAPAAGSGNWDFYHTRISVDTNTTDGMIITLQDADGLEVTVDLDPDGFVSKTLARDLPSGMVSMFQDIPTWIKTIKGALSPYIKNAPVFVQRLPDTSADFYFLIGLPSAWTIISALIVTGDSTYTMNKVGAGLDELTVEDVELTFTNNDDLKVTVNGTDYTDTGFTYLTAGSEDSFIGQANGFLDAIDAAIAATSDNKIAYCFPVSIDKANDAVTYRIAYDSASTVALSVVAVAD